MRHHLIRLSSFCRFMVTVSLWQITLANVILRPAEDLTTQCFDFPNTDFGKSNNVRVTYGSSPKLMMNVGDQAIDFTLTSVQV